MPNPVKYSASQVIKAIGLNAMWLGVNESIEYAPTASTDWWSGYSPGLGGYTIYIQKASEGPSIYSPANDSELINTVRVISQAQNQFPVLSSVYDAINWVLEQNEMIVVNFDYPPIVTDGLVLLFDSGFTTSYPKGGTEWKDISGSEKHGTLINSPAFSTDNGGILNFDSQFLQYATAPDLGTLTTFTVSSWFKLSTLPTTAGCPAIVTNIFDGLRLNFSIGLNKSPFSANICFGFFDGSWRTTDGFPPSTGIWYNVVGTYDGTTLKQYLNGFLNTTLSYTGTPQSSGLGLRIARRWDSPETEENFIDGQIPVVMIYNRALSEAEVYQNYDSLISRF